MRLLLTLIYLTPRISHYLFEKQFQEVYTIAKFKEVQDKFRGFLYLSTSLLGCEGAKYMYIVTDEFKVSDEFIKYSNFIVSLDEDSQTCSSCPVSVIRINYHQNTS